MIKVFPSVVVVLVILVFNCTVVIGQDPLFPNSVVSNDIDFIREADPDSYRSLAFIGLDNKEMPSSISNNLFDTGTYVFEATFSDGETLEIWCHSSFQSQAAAKEYADKLSPRLGKLPAFQRNMLDHVVIHTGDAGAFAEIEGQFFVLYADNMDDRISTNDLEETVFHESVHASYQFMYQNDPSWLSAQSLDPTFVTDYGQANPTLEDMAESALFAYTIITYPGRLSEDIENWLLANIPNRLEWFGMIYSDISETSEEIKIPRLTLYPNPSNGVFTLELEKIGPHDLVYIYNLTTGIPITSLAAENGSNLVDLNGNPDGVYLIRIKGMNAVYIKNEFLH